MATSNGVDASGDVDSEEDPDPAPRKMASKFILPVHQDIGDEWAEAWDELGAPILIPFIKFLIAVSIYFIDSYFLVKNTYSAIKHKNDSNSFGDPRVIAAFLVGFHIFSSLLISVIDSLNKDAITGRRGKYLSRKYKGFIFLRWLAHLTLTMRLFRLFTAYLENRRRNKQIQILRMRRTKLSAREIRYVVDQKRNQLVESHYDLVDSFFKTVPTALVQVFLMSQSHPGATLKLYSTVDQDRLATIFFTIISASISATNYQADYLAYKKVLRFEDCFKSGFKLGMNLVIPAEGYLVTNFVNLVFSIGIRICFYSAIIFWSPFQFIVSTLCILTVNYVLIYVWNKSSWRFRPVLDNPLHGIPWPGFDLIDLWINLFVPGVHYPKPLDHLLNFYTTVFCGLIVFGTWDFLFPTKTAETPGTTNATLPIYQELLNKTKTISGEKETTDISRGLEDPAYIVWTVVQYLLTIHEYLTRHEISYQGFFFNVIKFMNIVNFFCLGYTCVLNWMKIYDLDFPIQIVNTFYRTIYRHLEAAGDFVVITGQVEGVSAGVRRYTKCEVFLVYSLLSNSLFFDNVRTLRTDKNWDAIKPQKLDSLVSDYMFRDEGQKSACYTFWKLVFDLLSPIFYPGTLRVAKLPGSERRKELSLEKASIIASVAKWHPLREEMVKFVDQVYDKLGPDGKLLLRIWVSTYDDIVSNYTSLRIRRTFQFLDIYPIEKTPDENEVIDRRTASGSRMKQDYEMGYIRRIINEARGLVELIQVETGQI